MKGSRNRPPQPSSASECPPRRLHDPSRTRARVHTHTHTQTCSQTHTRALRYTCTLPQTHAAINTCKQTRAHLCPHARRNTCAFAHMHTCKQCAHRHASASASTERFSPGREGLKASEASLRLAPCIRRPARSG